MMKWDLLLEDRKYSCVMAPAPPEISDAVLRWGKMFIGEDELYLDQKDPDGFGREDDVHVTVKFGLHEAEPSEELLRVVEETQPFEIEVGPCTLFENEKYDVVKFDVDGEDLREMNRRISELPNSDEHPEYHPHLTVAYVTKGCCHELIGKSLLDPESELDLRFLVKAVTFSSPNSRKTTLFLGKPNLAESVDHPRRQEGTQILGRTYEEVQKIVLDHIRHLQGTEITEGLDFEVLDVIPTGSRVHGRTPPREDSDFDVVVLYRGFYEGTDKELREDDLLNALNRSEEDGGEPLYIDGIRVDMNPICIQRYQEEPHVRKAIMGEAERRGDNRAVTNKGAKSLAKPTPLNIDRLPKSKMYRVVPASVIDPFAGSGTKAKFFMSPQNRFVEVFDHEPSAAAMFGQKKDPDDSWLDRFSAKLNDAGWIRIIFSGDRVTFTWNASQSQLDALMNICVENKYVLEDDRGQWPKEIYVPDEQASKPPTLP